MLTNLQDALGVNNVLAFVSSSYLGQSALNV